MGKRRESFEAVQRSVVRVKDADGQTWGTGFFISREGHLLTCAHVVQDAGGWKNVRILDQPVSCLYEGDPDRDDFCLLQVEDLQVTPVELGKDFDPGDEFLSFGFSNDDFYGAPIRGEITAFARCGKLGDQKLIRLETFSDAQRIEGGQSGAPVFVYKRGKYKVIGLIAASEDLSGGLAVPSTSIQKNIKTSRTKQIHSKSIWLPATLSITSLAAILTWYFISNNECSSSAVNEYVSTIRESIKQERFNQALNTSSELIRKCPNDYQGYRQKGASLTYLQQTDDAVSAYEKALEKKPSLDRVYELSLANMRAERYEDAVKEFNLLLNSNASETLSVADMNEVYLYSALTHHKIAYKELINTSGLRDSNNLILHLKKAEELYNKVINGTRDYCRKANTGSCYSKKRADAADNLAAVYSSMYSLDNKNPYYLKQAIETIKTAFEAKLQEEREKELNLYVSSKEDEILEQIDFIRSSSDFKNLINYLSQRYKISVANSKSS